ncbi:MAG: 50S ribosomal protein L13 [Candidatus Omnitrophica bacterium]|nr:50S ribosomal protein L13 [Candidatus Omnitrophota bacterium]MCF7877482.1 50S ribosomal protein L13 [Candidatus Omnitrophota bacterium]MCF7891538.1 50S ribosomal protein L13 [Candidatus Omnitrophota bacterium]MCF7897350.1 50S ribosomal protein L13 [Candidatus Omnitrophota bacterium]MCF7909680.1 50S ribosomal protein L13 [Candidatus Omnitrophota bacterium]
MRKTKFYKKDDKDWVLINAQGKILGRLATRIAKILQGKHKADYTPNSICGDKVVVINAKKIKVTGKKEKDKKYDKYSGYPGGRKEISLEELSEKNPSKVLFYAVGGMLPKNLLRKNMLRSLKIYPDSNHEQTAQQPKEIYPVK